MARCTAPLTSGSRCASAAGAAPASGANNNGSETSRARSPTARRRSAREVPAQEAERIGGGEVFGSLGTAMAVFEHAFLESAFAHDHPMRNADELRVREL